jgi:hypothetical protein
MTYDKKKSINYEYDKVPEQKNKKHTYTNPRPIYEVDSHTIYYFLP